MRITVTRGVEKYSPIQFHTFDVGPFSVDVDVPDGEDPTPHVQKVRAWLTKLAEAEFAEELPRYLARVQKARDAADATKRGVK